VHPAATKHTEGNSLDLCDSVTLTFVWLCSHTSLALEIHSSTLLEDMKKAWPASSAFCSKQPGRRQQPDFYDSSTQALVCFAHTFIGFEDAHQHVKCGLEENVACIQCILKQHSRQNTTAGELAQQHVVGGYEEAVACIQCILQQQSRQKATASENAQQHVVGGHEEAVACLQCILQQQSRQTATAGDNAHQLVECGHEEAVACIQCILQQQSRQKAKFQTCVIA
jgi:hypothetical protein